MVYPHKWSPISYRSSAGRRKHAGQRPMLYRWTTQPSPHPEQHLDRFRRFSRAHDRDRRIYRPRCRPSVEIGRIYRPTAYVVLRCSLIILACTIFITLLSRPGEGSMHGSFDECNWVTVSNLRRSQTTYTLTLYSDFAHLVTVRSAKSFK